MPMTLSRRQFLAGSTALLGSAYYPFSWANNTSVDLPIPPLMDGSDGSPI